MTENNRDSDSVQETNAMDAAIARIGAGKGLTLEPVDLGAAQPAHVIGQVYMAGQPSQADIATLKAKGIKTVVNFRTDGEIDWDEQAVVEAAGMKYVNLPFKGATQLTDDVFDQAREVLNQEANKPVLLHCGSSNRVGAVWLAHRVLDDGLSLMEATEEAKTAGLRSQPYQEKAEAYIQESE